MITYRKLHNLKLESQYVKPIVEKEKTFEIRYNDRNYKVGDIIKFNPITNSYYGDIIKYKFYIITYILDNFGLSENYIAFSFKELTDEALIDSLATVNAYFKCSKIIPIPDNIITSVFLDSKSERKSLTKAHIKENEEELNNILKELNKK